jgi:hypothetical protein
MMLSSGSGHDINTLAAGARLPTMHTAREDVEAGGLISYGSNCPDPFRRPGDYADRILRGAQPADLPVEQPTKFDLVVNLTSAKALGLTFPENLPAAADRPGTMSRPWALKFLQSCSRSPTTRSNNVSLLRRKSLLLVLRTAQKTL